MFQSLMIVIMSLAKMEELVVIMTTRSHVNAVRNGMEHTVNIIQVRSFLDIFNYRVFHIKWSIRK